MLAGRTRRGHERARPHRQAGGGSLTNDLNLFSPIRFTTPRIGLGGNGPPPAFPPIFLNATRSACGCLLWKGGLTSKGYGRLQRNKKQLRAHRVAWEEANGPIPDGLDVLHRCDVRHCIEITHLFLGTNGDNVADMLAKGRQLAGERNAAAKLTVSQVIEIRSLKGSPRIIAERFGVSPSQIGRIRSRQTWAHL